jgi:deoxyribonuclease-4
MDVPKILETPYVPISEDGKTKVAPYKLEIEMLKAGVFNPELKEQLKNIK